MNAAWWFMAAHHELEQDEMRVSEPVAEAAEVIPKAVKPKRLECPKCGRTGRGIAKHIHHCKG